MLVIPFIEYQAATRTVCSRRLHHICVMATKAGAMLASKVPRKKRAVRRPPKLCAAAMQDSVAPQNSTMVALNFPMGSLTSSQATAGCATSCAR